MDAEQQLAEIHIADQRQSSAADMAREVVAYWTVLRDSSMPKRLVETLTTQYNVTMLRGEFEEYAD